MEQRAISSPNMEQRSQNGRGTRLSAKFMRGNMNTYIHGYGGEDGSQGRQPRTQRHKWQDNIKIDLRELCSSAYFPNNFCFIQSQLWPHSSPPLQGLSLVLSGELTAHACECIWPGAPLPPAGGWRLRSVDGPW